MTNCFTIEGRHIKTEEFAWGGTCETPFTVAYAARWLPLSPAVLILGTDEDVALICASLGRVFPDYSFHPQAMDAITPACEARLTGTKFIHGYEEYHSFLLSEDFDKIVAEYARR